MLSSDHWNNEDLVALREELTALYEATPSAIRGAVSRVAQKSSPTLVERFYTVLLSQPRAGFYLDQQTVSERLHASLEKWIIELLPARLPDVEKMIQKQTEVGNVHARIHIPISLVMRGFRELKHGIAEEIARTRLTQDEAAVAVHFISIMFDLAFSIMSAAYVIGSERAARSDEALRLFTAGQDLMTERERQRASLAEWAQSVFLNSQLSDEIDIQPLSESEFALWFVHRASLLFGHSSEFDSILGAMRDTDLATSRLRQEPAERQTILRAIKQNLDRISSLLSMLFERCQDDDRTRDPLTRVFNRRFLSTVISREIEIHKETRRPFSVIMFAIDQAEKVRAKYGEDDIDTIVQHTATMLFQSARRSDSVFRMGQETFLVLRVEADIAKASEFAREIVGRYSMTHFDVNGRTHLDNSLSFAVAEYDGHPDPRRMVVRAQQALKQQLI